MRKREYMGKQVMKADLKRMKEEAKEKEHQKSKTKGMMKRGKK